jgi:glycogen operon protein
MFAGRNAEDTRDDIIYYAINTYWEKQYFQLPTLPSDLKWHIAVNTAMESPYDCIENFEDMMAIGTDLELEARSVVILIARKPKD